MESNTFRNSILILLLLGFTIIFNSCSTENTPVYQLTTSPNPSEGGSVSPAEGEYDEGEQVQITANSNEHWVFQEWQGGLSGTQNPASVTMDADKSVTALFVKREYPLTLNIEGEGTVDEQVIQPKSTDYPHGTTVELTANPAEGWEFTEWQGVLSGNENPETVTIENQTEITAVFKPIDYQLTVEIEGSGKVEQEIVQSKSNEYPFGSNIQLTAIADENWKFNDWSGDIEETENPITIEIDGNKKVTASFNTIPTIETTSINDIDFDSAVTGGEITDDGGSEIIESGVCWDVSENPNIDGQCTNDGNKSGNYTSVITNLKLGTNYFVRAYAINDVGIAYGENLEFKTKDQIKDIDGNKYKVVKIGSQFWIAENLRTTKYRDGSNIPNIVDDFNWQRMGVGAWSYYNNDSSKNKVFGKLYNWFTVVDDRGICPKGWKIPTLSDWNIMGEYLDTSEGIFDANVAGKLKATGTEYWNPPNSGATNESGFTAMPGGARLSGLNPSFKHMGNLGVWWTIHGENSTDDWSIIIYYDYAQNYIATPDFRKKDGLSVRCMKY